MHSFIIELIKILSKREKVKFLFLAFLAVILGTLEAISIGSIYPLLHFLFDENSNQGLLISSDSGLINYFYNFFLSFDNFSYENKLKILIFIFFIIFTFKLLFQVFFIYFQQKTIWEFNFNLSNLLFKKYLNTSYKIISFLTPEVIVRNINNSVSDITSGINNIFNIFSEFIILIGLLVLLLFINHKVVITSIFIFSFIGILYFIFFKKKIYIWGYNRQKYNRFRIKKMSEIVSFFREIKIYKISKLVFSKFYFDNEIIKSSNQKYSFFNLLPKVIFEFLFVIILIFIFLINNTGGEFDISLSVIGLFVIASLKLLPSINKILIYSQQILFIKSPFEDIKKDLSLDSINYEDCIDLKKKLTFNSKIKFENLSFSFDKNVILQDLNLTINKNEFIIIKGKSGSGKSTLLNILLGFYVPQSGKIMCDTSNIHEHLSEWFNKLSFVSQETILVFDSIKENIFFDRHIDSDTLKNTLDIVGLNYLENFKNNINSLSGGEKQRINYLRSIIKNSQILLFDEPTSALDNYSAEKIIKSISEQKGKKTIIIISHQDYFDNYADNIYEITNKNIYKIN